MIPPFLETPMLPLHVISYELCVPRPIAVRPLHQKHGADELLSCRWLEAWWFHKIWIPQTIGFLLGYGSIPINTIFRGMNIHLPAILMFTRGTRFWHTVIDDSQFWMILGYPYFRKPPYIWLARSFHTFPWCGSRINMSRCFTGNKE